MSTLGPLLPGRIPNSLAFTRSRQQLNNLSGTLQRLRDQISTGQRYQLPSENSASAVRTLVLQKTIERKIQLHDNVRTSQSQLAATENALAGLGDVTIEAKSILLQGLGDGVTSTEKRQLAEQVDSLISQSLLLGNSKFGDRYLFAGTQSAQQPFERGHGGVLFRGNDQAINSFVSFDELAASNVSPIEALAPLNDVVGADVDPALTSATRLSDLNGGAGVQAGNITVTVDTGGGPQVETIDLTGAETIQDVITRIEAPFSGDLTVDVDPTANNGLRLTPSAGTVAVADEVTSFTASDLGIASTATAQIVGTDVEPRLTLQTTLASLNGGTGVGLPASDSFQITIDGETRTFSVTGLNTVEDLFNHLQSSDFPLDVGFNDAGTGFRISSRVSGTDFSIGEAGGNTATLLGLRTFSGDTRLEDLNNGRGIPLEGTKDLEITRRDGTELVVDLDAAETIQDVLDAINAVDPGNLVASLNTTGNGISLIDNSGTGPLTVHSDVVSESLGVAGSETGTDPLVALTGGDVNPQRAEGLFDLLIQLQTALETDDDLALTQLQEKFDRRETELNLVRGEVGSRLRVLDRTEEFLLDEELLLEQRLSEEFDTDFAAAVSELSQAQFLLEASQQVTVQTLQLSLINFL